MTQPAAARPYMPGYGILSAGQGSGLLPWSWAAERLTTSRHYWLATTWPDGHPHVMPVWGVWDGASFWSSSGGRSRKVRNLRADPRCVATTENPMQPVVVEGVAEIVIDRERIHWFVTAVNTKYGESIDEEFLDPAVNATIRVRLSKVIGLDDADFVGSPTRWDFPGTTRGERA